MAADAAEVPARGWGPKFFLMGADRGLDLGQRRIGARGRGPFQGRHGDPADLVVMAAGIRPNTELPKRRPLLPARASWSTTRCRPTTRKNLRRRRMRAAPRHRLRPGGAAVRAGQGLRQPPGQLRHRLTPARSLRPSSRSPASTCSRPATSWAARTPRNRAATTGRRASKNWS